MICPIVYDKFLSTVFDELNRKKFEYYIGCLLLKVPEFLPKYMILYGTPGCGKSTTLKYVTEIFEHFYLPYTFVNYDTDFGALPALRSDVGLADDAGVNRFIKHVESYDPPVNMRFILCTNKLPTINDEDCMIVQFTGRRFSKEDYQLIYRGLLTFTPEFGKYCMDKTFEIMEA